MLSISGSTFHARPSGESEVNLTILAEIDRQFLETLFHGVRQMAWHLRANGWPVNIKRVRRLMCKMGLMPIDQRPRTYTPAPGCKIYPYLLRGLSGNGSAAIAGLGLGLGGLMVASSRS
ncbi:MAG: transposase [Rhizobiales bacterium]|nr:transposase [Hyphomicrobiales bacterium]